MRSRPRSGASQRAKHSTAKADLPSTGKLLPAQTSLRRGALPIGTRPRGDAETRCRRGRDRGMGRRRVRHHTRGGRRTARDGGAIRKPSGATPQRDVRREATRHAATRRTRSLPRRADELRAQCTDERSRRHPVLWIAWRMRGDTGSVPRRHRRVLGNGDGIPEGTCVPPAPTAAGLRPVGGRTPALPVQTAQSLIRLPG